jgi:hypothetical protein
MTVRPRDYLWPVLFCVGGLVLAHHPMVLTGFRSIQNDPGDTRYIHLMLEHAYRWATFQPGHEALWSPAFFYPAQNSGAYADMPVSAMPFYAPWRLVGFAPDTSFQLWLLLTGAVNFAVAFVLFNRSFKLGPLGSSAGAGLFAFGASRVNQTMHPQLFPAMWTALCVLAISRLFSDDAVEQTPRRRRVWIWVAGLSVAAQFWAGFYLAWFLVFSLAIAGVVALALPGSRRAAFAMVKAYPVTLLAAAVASALVLLPMAQHYLEAAKDVGMRTYGEALTMIPGPLSWLDMGPASWAYAWLWKVEAVRTIPMEHEQRIGFGLVTTALGLVGLFWCGRKHAAIRLLALTGLGMFLLSTHFGGFTLWKWVFEYFPGAKAVRGVSRIGLAVLLPMGLGLAVFVSWLSSKGRAAFAGALALALVAMAEQGETTPSFDKQQAREDVAAIAAAIPAGCKAFLFSPVQGYGPYWKYQLDAMWASMQSGVPTLNGYSGNNPPYWPFADTNIHSEGDEYRVAAAAKDWVARRQLNPSTLCWVKVGLQEGPYRAEFVSQQVPQVMVAGFRYPVAVTFRNTSQGPWKVGELFRLGAQAPPDTPRWSVNRVELPGDVGVGQTVTFQFEVTAPGSPGVHGFQWRLVREGVAWIGPLSPLLMVRVEAKAPDASTP